MKKKLMAAMSGPTSIVACRMPDDIVAYIDRTATNKFMTRSDILRSLLVESLRSQGIVATEAERDAERAA